MEISLTQDSVSTIIERLESLYTTINNNQGTGMGESVYELNCESCGSEYELAYSEHSITEQPIYCPFCGSDIDLSEVEDDLEEDDFFDELDFDDERD